MRSGRRVEAGGTWWSLLEPLALLLEREGVPALEVAGGGGHVQLKVDAGQAS